MNAKPYHLEISARTKFLNFLRQFFIFSGFDKFLAKYIKNYHLFSFASKLIPPNYLYQPGTLRNCNLNGINFKLDVSDVVGHTNYYSIGDNAEHLLFDFVKPGMVVIDIGANIGATTLNIAKRILPNGKIFSFEPSPYNYKRASENISLNSFSNINLINQGLGHQKATAFLYNVNSHNRGMQRMLANNNETTSYEKTAVEIDTLDCSMKKFNIPAPSLIKIDVEGYELKVLTGASETILKHRPVLFIELDDENLKEQGNNAKELVTFLIDRQYKILNASTAKPVNENIDFTNCHFDILCTPGL